MRGENVHFDILVEDQSGKNALNILVPKILGTADEAHTFEIHWYKGIGHIPNCLKPKTDAKKRILLDQLPRVLRGYGKTYAGRRGFPAAVIVVCDLDDKCLKSFRNELLGILDQCNPAPTTRFCIAVAEGEAWFLGDIAAIKSAFPNAKDSVLDSYVNDSICGTWELLADAVYKGGHTALASQGRSAVGAEKSVWAERICPYMDIDRNLSPSFGHFKKKVQELAQANRC